MADSGTSAETAGDDDEFALCHLEDVRRRWLGNNQLPVWDGGSFQKDVIANGNAK